MAIEKGKFPTTTACFENIREDGMYYVDKTRLVWQLVNESKIVFLSRPRRFGKSMLLDTIACYLEGKKPLFEGLKLHPFEEEKGEKSWEQSPVLRFDFSARGLPKPEALEQMVRDACEDALEAAGINEGLDAAPVRINRVLQTLRRKTGHRVGLLIDEYDSPLLDMLSKGDPEGLGLVKEYLRGFYRSLKSAEGHIRFMMVTGISQFRQVGLFSGFNNIRDISFHPDYNAICGFSAADIQEYLSEQVAHMATENGLSVAAQMAALKHKYDGYRFSKKEEDVYNPYGLMHALMEGELHPYWTMVGTMSRVAALIPRYDALGLVNLDGEIDCDLLSLSNFDYEHPAPIPFLYQTGYLTIKGVTEHGDFLLDFPNEEVRASILRILAPRTLGLASDMSYLGLQRNLLKALNGSDIKTLEACIQAFLASLPFDSADDAERAWALRECRYRDALHLIFAGVRSDVRVEQIGAGGLSDVEILGERMIVVMELNIKRHGMTAERALEQTVGNEYTTKHVGGEKPVWAVGAVIGEKARIEWAERCMWEGESGKA